MWCAHHRWGPNPTEHYNSLQGRPTRAETAKVLPSSLSLGDGEQQETSCEMGEERETRTNHKGTSVSFDEKQDCLRTLKLTMGKRMEKAKGKHAVLLMKASRGDARILTLPQFCDHGHLCLRPTM